MLTIRWYGTNIVNLASWKLNTGISAAASLQSQLDWQWKENASP